jgi:aspartyl-tRNA(Asn)/glutamyl-tRNA(Gln) amidotransferase subunit A
VAIGRLKAAGMIVIGRTNMTEFAYSGVGLNPHYGSPRSPFDRATGRISGGSSSGAGVSVADGMVSLAIGTDTGGSCRIPASYCGVVGYKSSHGRVPLTGCYPLSASFDTIGPLAPSVDCCAKADALMAGDWDGIVPERQASGLRLAVLRDFVLDGLSPASNRLSDGRSARSPPPARGWPTWPFPNSSRSPRSTPRAASWRRKPGTPIAS